MIEREEDRNEMYQRAAARIEQRGAPAPERTTLPRERETSGQFRSSEPAYGQAGLERDAGYKPLKDDRDEPEGLTVRDATTERARETQSRPIEVHESGLDEDVTLSAIQAAKRVAEARKADADQAALDHDKAVQKSVDELRAPAPETEPRQPQQFEAEPDIEKALSHPKVRDAISAKVTEAETQRQHFETSVQEVGKARIAALAADFPELVKLPLNQWASAINELGKRDLPRARQIAARLHGLAEVETAMGQIKAQKTAREQTEFKAYSAKENARFKELTKGMTPQQMQAVQAEVPAMMAEYGVTNPRQFLEAISGQTSFPRASAERIMVDAARWRLAQKAAKAQPTRAVPNVMRPGVAAPRTNPASASLQSLNQKLSQSGDIKDATRLLVAKRASERRGR